MSKCCLTASPIKKGSVFLVKLAKQIVVRGRVQGVGFRWATKIDRRQS